MAFSQGAKECKEGPPKDSLGSEPQAIRSKRESALLSNICHRPIAIGGHLKLLSAKTRGTRKSELPAIVSQKCLGFEAHRS